MRSRSAKAVPYLRGAAEAVPDFRRGRETYVGPGFSRAAGEGALPSTAKGVPYTGQATTGYPTFDGVIPVGVCDVVAACRYQMDTRGGGDAGRQSERVRPAEPSTAGSADDRARWPGRARPDHRT